MSRSDVVNVIGKAHANETENENLQFSYLGEHDPRDD